MKHKWFSILVSIAIALSVWGLMPAGTARAATCTWTGGVSTAWEITGNWSGCQGTGDAPPANNDTVIIPVATNNPTISTAATTGLNVTIQNGGRLTNSSSGAIAFVNFTVDNGGTYIHDRVAALPGTVRSFGAASTVEILRHTATACPVAANYGNLIINVSNFSQNNGCSGNLSSIAGNLEIKNTSGFQLRLVNTQTTAHNIGGNLIIDGGTLVLSSGTGNPVVTISGNVSVTSGILDLGNSTGAPTLNISGNFDQSGGTLQRGGSNNRAINLMGNWTRTGGTFTNTGIGIVFNGTTQQTLGGSSATTFATLTVASSAQVILPTSVTATTLTNNGTITQTQTANGNTPLTFIGAGGYGGVILNANNLDLGSTDVVIKGNQTCNVGNQLINRCFNINPFNNAGRSATITFFFTDAELNGSSCAMMEVYHWNGTTWDATPLTRDTTYGPTSDGRDCTGNPRSIRVTGVTTFSPFGLTSAGSAPTAITLRQIDVRPSELPLAAFIFAFGLLIAAGGLLALRRRKA